MKHTILTSGIVALLSGASASNKVYIDTSTRTLRDTHDRQLTFHGVNVVFKIDPYIPEVDTFDPENSLSSKDIADLKSWGINMVRLGVMWEAVERTAGKYDENYLNRVESLINKLGEAGIYTMIDAHQDVMAREICGEGMPDFYAK